MTDRRLAALSLAAMAAAGLLVGSLVWQWVDESPQPGWLSTLVRGTVAFGCWVQGLRWWSQTSWSTDRA